MAEYIKREDAIDLFWTVDTENNGDDGYTVVIKFGRCYDSNEIEALLSKLPAADVAEVRHAFWSDYGSGVCCTNCGVSLFHQDENNNWGIEPSKFMFCPSCGALMDEEDEHEAD